MKTTVIGLVSNSCHECEDLRQTLVNEFGERGVELEFVDVSFDDDPVGSVEAVAELGLVNPPAFLVGGVVFVPYFSSSDIDRAIEGVNGLQ